MEFKYLIALLHAVKLQRQVSINIVYDIHVSSGGASNAVIF